MGPWYRWIRLLFLFFAAVTRRLVVFPLGAVPVTLTGTAGAWGAWVANGDQIAANVGTRAIRIYQIDMSNPTAPVDFEVRIGYGLVGAETWLGVVTMNLASVPLPFPLEVPAGQRLAAQCRDSAGGNTVDAKILAYTIT
ncbi:hypothetical protein ES703_00341 [subsurface metagenome]